MYSGRCDFYDWTFMNADSDEAGFEKFKGTKLYKYKPRDECVEVTDLSHIRDNWIEIEYESIEDLIQYYPYLVTLGFCDNQDSNKSTVVLASRSYVDIEEEEILNLYLKQILRFYNRFKRKHQEFDKEYVMDQVCFIRGHNEEPISELIDRVEKFGKKATIDGIHLPMSDYYRRQLQEEFEKHGIKGE